MVNKARCIKCFECSVSVKRVLYKRTCLFTSSSNNIKPTWVFLSCLCNAAKRFFFSKKNSVIIHFPALWLLLIWSVYSILLKKSQSVDLATPTVFADILVYEPNMGLINLHQHLFWPHWTTTKCSLILEIHSRYFSCLIRHAVMRKQALPGNETVC